MDENDEEGREEEEEEAPGRMVPAPMAELDELTLSGSKSEEEGCMVSAKLSAKLVGSALHTLSGSKDESEDDSAEVVSPRVDSALRVPTDGEVSAHVVVGRSSAHVVVGRSSAQVVGRSSALHILVGSKVDGGEASCGGHNIPIKEVGVVTQRCRELVWWNNQRCFAISLKERITQGGGWWDAASPKAQIEPRESKAFFDIQNTLQSLETCQSCEDSALRWWRIDHGSPWSFYDIARVDDRTDSRICLSALECH